MNYVGNDEQLIKYSYLCIYGQPNISTIDPYKVRSGIIGFAIGDALGVPVEFTDRQSRKIAPVTDMQGYGSHHVPEGTWSDDTSMSIAFMDSVIKEEKIDYDDIMQRFCDWCIKAEYTATDKVFDIGITTRQALSAYYYKRNDALHCGLLDYNSNGNGSLMRMLPVAIYLYANKFSETEEVEIVNNLSGLTHAHEISKLGCKIYCDYMKRILSGIDKKQAYEQLKSIEYDKYYSTETIDKYSRLLRGDISKLTESEISSSGYIVSTLEASIWCTLNSQKYDEAVLKAVNLGSDTDTVGAITGGINGCIYGENNFPDNWKSKLKKYNYLVNMSNGFSNILNNQKNKHLSM
ncbi:MAG: ADP-ribosylglycohydrolase family protein [Bacilli bacterium]|nr:ADP-ribosylglycohydrolase family protein [Bacilli bacterium]